MHFWVWTALWCWTEIMSFWYTAVRLEVKWFSACIECIVGTSRFQCRIDFKKSFLIIFETSQYLIWAWEPLALNVCPTLLITNRLKRNKAGNMVQYIFLQSTNVLMHTFWFPYPFYGTQPQAHGFYWLKSKSNYIFRPKWVVMNVYSFIKTRQNHLLKQLGTVAYIT